jgi:hypothetical protein
MSSIRNWPCWPHMWIDRQAGLVIPLILTPVGLVSLILGDNVSKAFANVGGDSIVRILGAAMVVGGIIALWGVWRNDPLFEVIGLLFIASGCSIYVVGDLLGLHLLGLLAAAGHLCVILTLVGRVYQINTASRVREQLDNPAANPSA